MATYKSIHGLKVDIVDTDAISSQILGGTWASGGSMNTARRNGTASGEQTAGLYFGGTPGSGKSDLNESYNGSSWTEVSELNTARDQACGAGPQTSALCYLGATPSMTLNCESWDGSSWTEVADTNTGRQLASSAGASNTSA